VAQKYIPENEYMRWNDLYQQALVSINNREQLISDAAELIEFGFELIGSTAIEDKLQEEVADVIRDIREAGIKLWVLTGDKVETAINIGFSCDLLDSEMEIFIIDKLTTKAIYRQILDQISKMKRIGNSRDKAVVVGGEQLTKILKDSKTKKLLQEFLNLVEESSVVLACRVSPKQKAEIVKLVRNNK
jgi:phospholipid-transporting ATPase